MTDVFLWPAFLLIVIAPLPKTIYSSKIDYFIFSSIHYLVMKTYYYHGVTYNIGFSRV